MINSNDIPLGSSPINRAAEHRTDEAWQSEAAVREDALFLLLQGGDPLLTVGEADRGLFWMGPEIKRLGGEAQRLFLGLDKAGSPVFAIELASEFDLEASLIGGQTVPEPLRSAMTFLGPLEANLATTARSLFEWHKSHPHCSRCGAKSESVEAGWKRICPACGAEHFPRTDPVAIMLAVKDDKCLLGRLPGWPEGMWSCLAGFVEPGETVEQAAARELLEEANIKADPATAEFLFCQPWPFASSLMMGLILQAETDDIQTEQDELEAAIWVSRDDARRIIAGEHADIFCPPPYAIAHHILKVWAERS